MVTSITVSKQFKKDTKRAMKRGKDKAKLENVIRKLATGETLPEKYRDHALKGSYVPARELHIEPDWLLVYEISEGTLHLVGHGTHSDLFTE
jgi:mRNA interferase YafQ